MHADATDKVLVVKLENAASNSEVALFARWMFKAPPIVIPAGWLNASINADPASGFKVILFVTAKVPPMVL